MERKGELQQLKHKHAANNTIEEEIWQEEKSKLLEIIQTQQQDAAKLAKRFKLLQETLKTQQQVLDRYQKALLQIGPQSTKDTTTTEQRPPSVPQKRIVLREKQELASGLQDEPFQPNKRSKTLMRASWPFTSSENAVKDQRDVDKKAHWVPRKPDLHPTTKPLRSIDNKLKRQAPAAAHEKAATESKSNASKPQEPAFQYVEVVRDRATRAALPGHDCVECRKYYEALDGLISEADIENAKMQCSRHRARFEPYQTPDDFWRLSFPDSLPSASPSP